MHSSKVTVHMACSLDFFVAKKDGSVDWMDTADSYEKGKSFAEAEQMLESIDCYVMGRGTYEHALRLGWPYGSVPTYVLTHRALPKQRDSVHFHAGDLVSFVNEGLAPKYRNIWLVGGPRLTREFLRLGLVDTLVVAILPILLGEGLPFVERVEGDLPLHLTDATAYENGVVEVCYELKK